MPVPRTQFCINGHYAIKRACVLSKTKALRDLTAFSDNQFARSAFRNASAPVIVQERQELLLCQILNQQHVLNRLDDLIPPFFYS